MTLNEIFETYDAAIHDEDQINTAVRVLEQAVSEIEAAISGLRKEEK